MERGDVPGLTTECMLVSMSEERRKALEHSNGQTGVNIRGNGRMASNTETVSSLLHRGRRNSGSGKTGKELPGFRKLILFLQFEN
jgi:hypothetical protein